MGRYVDAVNKGIGTLMDNKEIEQEYLEEYKTRKSLIEATYENDALGRNVLKAIEEDLIKMCEENLLMIDEIIANESLMRDAAERKEKMKQEMIENGQTYEEVEVDNSSINTSPISKPRLNDKISMRSMK